MRTKVLMSLCVTAVLGVTPALAQTIEERYLTQLKSQGFTVVSVSRTWLGRTRITASSKSKQREIIFNTRSGEVLRDYYEDSDGDDVTELLDLGSGDEGNSGSSGDSGSSGGASGGASGGSGGGSGGGGGFRYLTGGNSLELPFDENLDTNKSGDIQ